VRAILIAFACLLPLTCLATDKEPDATCIVRAAAAGAAPLRGSWRRGGAPLVLAVHLDCENLDGTEPGIDIDRVDVTYVDPDDRTAPVPRPHRQSLRGRCTGDGADLDVTILTTAQVKRLSRTPMTLEAHLSFHARQHGGRHRQCFGSMQWTVDVQ
jgi:hypothetical protein